MSRVHAPLDGWLRRGRPEPAPAHVEACAACRRALAEADEVRSWFPAPPPLVPDRAAAIRFALQAEARRPAAPRRRRWPLVAFAGLALASAAAAAHVVHRLPPASSPPLSTAVEPVVIRPPMRWSDRPTEPPRRRVVVAMVARPARGPDVDERFHTAWQLLGAGHAAAAATALDGLLAANLDDARRADVLFWSAQAHVTAGQPARARERLETLLRDHPSSWHRADAEELLRAIE